MAVVTLLLLVGGGAAGWWFWSHPIISVRNNLITPVTLRTDGVPPFTVGAGQRHELRLPSRKVESLEWEIETAPSGTLSSGSTRIDLPSRTAFTGTAAVDPMIRSERWFAALVTNETSARLCVVIDDVIRTAGDSCDVSIAPGATQVFTGYRRLSDDSYIRAVRPDGIGTTYRDIAASVNPRSGAITLKFTPDHFVR